ncbi:MAG: type IV pilus assembly protein PilM [Phycisphaeraceae bacterium]|nr:type IV pilus assembly protein PilM [Phycisphaeraceae bacterium]
MARKNDAWGLEVGQYAIKAMRLIRTHGQVEVADWDYLPFKQVLSTPDMNVDEAIQVGLDAFMSKHPDAERSQIVIGVPGHLAFARFAKLPPVEPKKIPSIVGYEAQQQIPFPIDQVEWDYQVFQQADSPDVEVGIFAITKERVAGFLSNYRSVGLRIDALTLSPLAVYNAFAYDNAETPDEMDGTVYMDIGTISTDVIIVESGGIWLRTLPIGGNHFTEALVKAFKISFSKAERYKREAAQSKYSRQIFSAMRPVFADLVQEIQRSIGYYQSLNRDAQLKQLVCVGSTFKLPGLSKFLKQQLQLKVVRPDSFKRLNVAGKQEAEFSTRVVNLATAYGLALQGVGLEQVSANVLPSYLVRQRVWRAKQPWIAAAAACVALGSALAGGKYYMDSGAHQGAMQETERVVSRVQGQAQRFQSEYQGLEKDVQMQRIANVRRILDYRNVWPLLFEDISQAALAAKPQPQLLQADYEQWKAIPRPQRRYLRIDRIETRYVVGIDTQSQTPGVAGSPAPMAMMGGTGGMGGGAESIFSQTFDTNQFWEQMATTDAAVEGVDPGMAGAEGMGDMAGATAPSAALPTESTVPRIKITLYGTTPYHEANSPSTPPAKFLNQTFLRYLIENSNRPDRPYKITLSSDPLTLGPVPEDPTLRAAAGMPGGMTTPGARSGRSAFPTAPSRSSYPPRTNYRNPGMSMGFEEDMEMMEFDGGMGGGSYNMGTTNIAAYYPQRPLQDETTSRDWQFTIRFTIELKKPENARLSEQGADKPPPAQPDGEQPAAPASPQPEPESAPPQPAANLMRQEDHT